MGLKIYIARLVTMIKWENNSWVIVVSKIVIGSTMYMCIYYVHPTTIAKVNK